MKFVKDRHTHTHTHIFQGLTNIISLFPPAKLFITKFQFKEINTDDKVGVQSDVSLSPTDVMLCSLYLKRGNDFYANLKYVKGRK